MPLVTFVCSSCGVTFERRPAPPSRATPRPCCSKRCAQRLGALATNLARWGETAPGTHRAKDRARCARRRARIAAQIVETVDPDVVLERDGWRCHLCRKRIDRSLDGNAPWGPTIDHLVPLADGGPHSYANVAAAHRLCNVRRVRGGVVQLALLG